MSEPNLPPNEPPPPNEKKPVNWPIALNLALLVGAVVFYRGELGALGFVIIALILVNGFAAMLTSFFGRLHWVAAFVLSALLVPLIGFGLCALYISANGGLGGGH